METVFTNCFCPVFYIKIYAKRLEIYPDGVYTYRVDIYPQGVIIE